MADERYAKYLGIDPAGETPTYYELLDISPTERDPDVLEKAYKTQIRKLQAVRTSKDTGWLDFHKETLREARRTLKDESRRAAYDETLAAESEREFKEFVSPLLALGQLSTTMIDAVLIPKAKSDGLDEARARAIIADLASEAGVTIASEDTSTSSADDDDYDEDDEDEEDGYEGAPDYKDATDYDDASSSGEVVLKPEAGWKPSEQKAPEARQREPEPHQEDRGPAVDPPWVMPEMETDRTPWGRGGSFSWGKAVKSSSESTADLLDESWLDEGERKLLEAAIALFNHGARLAKVGADVHRNLRNYFPPANGKAVATPKINGVSFEKLFETERKTYLDTLKAFKDATAKVGSVKTARADEIRDRGTKNIALVNSYIDEMKQHKMGLMGGLSMQETLRAWQAFVNSRRSPRLHRTIQELASA